jgi:AraC-like DNA-binding protein
LSAKTGAWAADASALVRVPPAAYRRRMGPDSESGEVYLSYARALFQYLEEHRVAIAPLLHEAGLVRSDLDDADRRIAAAQYAHLWKQGEALTGDVHLGLHAGAIPRPGKYGILGFAMMACDTLGEALERQRRYQDLVGKTGVSELRQLAPDLAELRWRSPLAGLSRHIAEEHVASWTAFAELLIGRGEHPDYVCFEHAPAGDTEAYARALGCEARFEQPHTAIGFTPALLDRPIRDQNPALKRLLDGHAEQLLTARRQAADAVGDVWQAVSGALVSGVPTLESIAQSLGCSPRGLQRRLAARGQNFKELIDEVRRGLALRYVDDASLSLLDIAFLLGFSEQSGFQRAFKRWTGSTPGAWRSRS